MVVSVVGQEAIITCQVFGFLHDLLASAFDTGSLVCSAASAGHLQHGGHWFRQLG